jgi:hypothetical protein
MGRPVQVGYSMLYRTKTKAAKPNLVQLVDADEKTYEWYKEHRGIDMKAERGAATARLAEPSAVGPVVKPPPYLGCANVLLS